jgi:hypothetical protein
MGSAVVHDNEGKRDVFMEDRKFEISQGQATADHVKENKPKKKWQKPKLEDVSGKVMAQPYIRFT